MFLSIMNEKKKIILKNSLFDIFYGIRLHLCAQYIKYRIVIIFIYNSNFVKE